MFGFGFVTNWTHNPIVHLLADNKVEIKVYERERGCEYEGPITELKKLESIVYHLFIQDKDGLKVFQLSIKEKPTYKKTFKNPKAGKHTREELDQTNKECVTLFWPCHLHSEVS
jgi:hypothetical protein